jgi:hypothetical protein
MEALPWVERADLYGTAAACASGNRPTLYHVRRLRHRPFSNFVTCSLAEAGRFVPNILIHYGLLPTFIAAKRAPRFGQSFRLAT